MDRLKEFLWTFKKNRKYQMIAGGIVLGLIIVVTAAVFAINRPKSVSQPINFNANTEDVRADFMEQKEVSRFIDGIKVPRGEENLYPTSIMIENLVTTRPQHSLSQASLVYEALAEGGITRFLAIYADKQTIKQIGPVRSGRPYFIDWADELAAVFMHAGGSPQTLSQIPKSDVVSVNQIGGDHAYFWRNKEFSAPHNLFTSSELITFVRRDKNIPETGSFEPWLFKSERALEERPVEEKNIVIDFSTFSYKVEYKYDRQLNDYLRFNGGEEHKDALNGQQIRVKNVVVQKVSTSLLESGANRLKMSTEGEGEVLIFQDGQVTEGAWKKKNSGERTRFYQKDGQEISFNPGNIWMEVIPTDREVTYN